MAVPPHPTPPPDDGSCGYDEHERSSLRELDHGFRLFVEHVREYAIFMIDPEGRVRSWNPGAQRITGYSAAEVLGRHVSIFYPPDLVERGVPAHELEVAREEGRFTGSGWRVRKDGSRFWAEAVITAVQNDEGELIGFGKLTRDLTGQKRTEEALRESEAKYRSIFEGAGEAFFLIERTPDGRFIYTEANPAVRRIGGIDPEDLVGRTSEELLPDEVARRAAELYTEIFATGQGREITATTDLPRGRVATRTRLHPLTDAAGRVVRILGIAEDITRQKRAEEERRIAHARFRRLVDSNIIGVAIGTPQGEILEANDYYLNLLGFTREELRAGKVRWSDVTPPEFLPADERALMELEERGVCTPYEKQHIRKDGSRVWVLIADAVLPGPGAHILGLVLDITDRKRTMQELSTAKRMAEVANRAKSDFLAVVSHELRTPLTAVLGYADLLEAGVAGELNDTQQQYLDRIERGAIHLRGLIDQILDIANIEAGREEVRPERVDAAEVARGMASLFGPRAEEKGLAFRLDFPDEPVHLRTDPAKLRQILFNLLSNAVKFTREGEVELSVRRQADGRVRFQVRDTGPGIPPEARQRIFERFTQLEEATTREQGGLGLGLALSRRLARLLGGDLTLESEMGVGSTFSFTLPAATAEEERRHDAAG